PARGHDRIVQPGRGDRRWVVDADPVDVDVHSGRHICDHHHRDRRLGRPLDELLADSRRRDRERWVRVSTIRLDLDRVHAGRQQPGPRWNNTTGTTTTVLNNTCATNSGWVRVVAPVTYVHSYTICLTNHDDNVAGDASYTYVDDVLTS